MYWLVTIPNVSSFDPVKYDGCPPTDLNENWGTDTSRHQVLGGSEISSDLVVLMVVLTKFLSLHYPSNLALMGKIT